MSETEPLLRRSATSRPVYDSVNDDANDNVNDDVNDDVIPAIRKSAPPIRTGNSHDDASAPLRLKRHITLPYAVAILVGNVIGSGIFLSPSGVTRNIGSVGASLLVWTATGFYNLAQALCYAELGTMIPRCGGDYSYVHESLGPLPAFMCLWIHVVVIASSSVAVIARTAGLYLLKPLGESDNLNLITLVAIIGIVTLASINALSTVWSVRLQAVFTVAKVLALVIVILVGVVKLSQGYTTNFVQPFDNTNTDAGSIALSVLDGYFAYKGWELINALPEEMVNPRRDLPLCVYIGMTLVTAIYVLTNVAYFSVLTPGEVVASDAVALSFAGKTMGSMAWIIPISVALSCMGAVNGDFLSNSRYIFAGGRFRQLPQVASFIHIKRLTPLVAIIVLCLLAMVYCVFTGLQKIQEYASLAVQFKMLLTLTALFYLRWTQPDTPRPYRVNTVLAVFTLLSMLALVGLSCYKDPVTSGVGAAMFAAGLPLYLLGVACHRSPRTNRAMDKVTLLLQKVLLVAPEEIEEKDTDN